MKKLTTSILTLMACVCYQAQSLSTVVTYQDKPTEKVTLLSGDELDSDQYEIDIHLTGTDDELGSISKYDVDQNVYVNGKKVFVSLWASYSDSKELGKSSIKMSLELEDIVEASAHLLQEKGNTLKVQFLNEKKANAELCFAEVKFDIPGFNESNSEFCGELLEYKSDDDKVDAVLLTIFKAVYPHTEVIEILMDDEWRITETMGGRNTYMVIYKNEDRLYMLRYSASYPIVEGKLQKTPRVKIYNGLDEPMPLGESCLNNLKTKLK